MTNGPRSRQRNRKDDVEEVLEDGRAAIPAGPVELGGDEIYELPGSDCQSLERHELRGSDHQTLEHYELPGSEFADRNQDREAPHFSSSDTYDSPHTTANEAHSHSPTHGMGVNIEDRIQVDEYLSSREDRQEPGLVEHVFTEEGRSRDYIVHSENSAVDASTFPFLLPGLTQSEAYVLAEKIAVAIREAAETVVKKKDGEER